MILIRSYQGPNCAGGCACKLLLYSRTRGSLVSYWLEIAVSTDLPRLSWCSQSGVTMSRHGILSLS